MSWMRGCSLRRQGCLLVSFHSCNDALSEAFRLADMIHLLGLYGTCHCGQLFSHCGQLFNAMHHQDLDRGRRSERFLEHVPIYRIAEPTKAFKKRNREPDVQCGASKRS